MTQWVIATVFQVLYSRWSRMEDSLICIQRGFDSKQDGVCCWLCVPCSPWRTVGICEPAAVIIGQLKLSVWRDNWQLFASTVCVRNMAWRQVRDFAAPADWLCCSSCLAELVKTADFIKLLTLWQTVCFCAANTHATMAVSRWALCYCAVMELLFTHRHVWK